MHLLHVVAGHPVGSRAARVWLLALAVLAACIAVAALEHDTSFALVFLIVLYAVLQVGVLLGVRRRNQGS